MRTWLRHGRPACVALALLSAVALALAVACSGGADKALNQELRIRIAGDPSTFDPQLASFAEEISVVKQLYRGLFTYDADLNVVPAVAKEVPSNENGGISDDGLTYTINLRNDATWSDGKPVTAHDFVYAFQRLFDPNAGAQGYYFSFYGAIKGANAFTAGEGTADGVGVSAKDDYTLVIELEHAQPTLPTLLALWPASPLRKDIIDQYGDAWTEPGHMISDGPFVLKDYSPNQQIVLESNQSYWSDAPKLESLVYRIIPDDSAAVIAYRNNEIDMTSVSPLEIGDFAENQQLRFGQLETYALQYNHSAAPLDNKLVRQAISRAVDRVAYVTAVQSGAGVPAAGWLPPGVPGASADIGQNLNFDTTEAKKLLAEAGYPDGDGFPSVSIMIVNDETNRLTGEFLQEQLRKNLGISIELDAVDESTWVDRYQSGDFQIVWASWFADYADPENWLPEQFGTDGGFNVLHYSNPQVDELLDQASKELNPSQRIALYDQVHQLLMDDQAVTPIFYPERTYVVKHNVDGLDVTPLDAEPGDWFAVNVQILAGGSAPPASDPDK